VSNTADFLVELGTEELPPKALVTLRDAFKDGVIKGIDAARLQHGEVLAYATPRRLAVLVKDLQTEQAAQQIENRGPPIAIAYDAAGNPTKAAKGFAAKCGISLEQITTTKTDKGEWLFFSGEVAGNKTAELLPAIVNESLAKLPIPKRMRWGDNSTEFVRPVHWLVMLLGDQVVAGTVLGLTAGRETRGHRFHAPEAISLGSPAAYVDVLKTQGKVIADFEERQAIIVAAAIKAAEQAGGQAILEPGVVNEVTALVEWPVPVVGNFAEAFLRLPPEVLISTLQDHQRYFPVESTGEGDNRLLPTFITFSNLDSKNPTEVRKGNERVVLPRLADAAFFWDQDAARTLASRSDQLQDVVYQQGLGSLYSKSQRVSQLACLLAGYLNADIAQVSRAAELARTDLLTNMVGEFPELQGRMGYYYALNDGEPEAVAIALEEQYLPRHAGDRLPATPVGQVLSIADRLDTLAGIFALGKRPSGNKDPFGLRRQALGLIRILIECDIDADIRALLAAAIELQPVEKMADGLADSLYEFMMERMRTWYTAGQAPGFAAGDISAEIFEAVLNRRPASPLDFHQRLQAVFNFTKLDAAASLAAANKRIANILKKVDDTQTRQVVAELFSEQEERTLHMAVTSILDGHQADLDNRNYESALQRLAALRDPVDRYFDEVMVMSEDQNQRANRLAQLQQLRTLFLDVADISGIPGR
jgi:glycyl-tRNA synthetase beta chain